MKNVALLGSTGSIGTQVLDVVSRLPERLNIVSMAANRNVELFAEQIKCYRPRIASIGTEQDAQKLMELLGPADCQIIWGEDGLRNAAIIPEADVTVVSVAGTVGLAPTIAAISAGKDIALASKEVLVAAGSLVTGMIRQKNVRLLPIDSEHSAIFQCLQGEDTKKISRLLLTASGGALAKYPLNELEHVTVDQALAHPNWSMGKKITIDSATLMNKVLEIVEAKWLFGVDVSQIEVVIHPQSIVHSMVEYIDGSIIAQMGVPDMRLPLQYALLYPERVDTSLPRLNIADQGKLTFSKPDLERYPAIELAYRSIQQGGTMPAVMNAANEIAVGMFLESKIGFLDIQRIVRKVMDNHTPVQDPGLAQILEADIRARDEAKHYMEVNID